ncbi:MAG: bacillithiol biosynthesis protein BshC [Acidobacteriota bacterium]
MRDDVGHASAQRPVETWVSLHPAALAAAPRELAPIIPAAGPAPRSARLAAALGAANRRWGNPVDGELERWLAGAEAVVTGQQPGLLGGPLLTLVKACAVAAEVARRRAAGRDAVGFLWLATADDDLPEMGWARVAVGEEVLERKEDSWRRGDVMGGHAVLGRAASELLERIGEQLPAEHAQHSIELAAACYRPGTTLGEATACFLARVLAGSGVVLVDALEPELARAARPAVERVLERLPEIWAALADGGERFERRGWSVPLRITPQTLPLFVIEGERRRRLRTASGRCPDAVRDDLRTRPEQFAPNAWLRPIVQDAALGTALAILGGAELAYHLQTAGAREIAGLGRPAWRLRPHVTVVTSAERRLARQLRLVPDDLLRAALPGHLLPGKKVRKRTASLSGWLDRRVDALESLARAELPGLVGDLEATRRRLGAATQWLEERVVNAATKAAEVDGGRWRRLRAFLRPGGKAQERELSALAPLLRLGLAWPAQLIDALDPEQPGMHLLFWEEGGSW